MTPIQILALVFALIGLIKLIVILVKPEGWLKVTEKVYSGNRGVTTFIFLILTIIVGYYVLQVLTIVQVAAVFLLMSMIMGLTMVQYKDTILNFAREIYNDPSMVKNSWLIIVIWIVISLWILYGVFM